VFLPSTLFCLYLDVEPAGHSLYMEHMQLLYNSLRRVEGWAGSDVPARVLVCDNRLVELKNLRRGLSQARTLPFDLEVFEKANAVHKRFRHFCLCLDYMVTRNSTSLKQHSAEWRATLVRGWFDADNTEGALEFVTRAEAFFQRHGKAALQAYALPLQQYEQPPLAAASPKRIKLSSSAASSTASANPYFVLDASMASTFQ
jgi:hypothetical protein